MCQLTDSFACIEYRSALVFFLSTVMMFESVLLGRYVVLNMINVIKCIQGRFHVIDSYIDDEEQLCHLLLLFGQFDLFL